MAAPTTAHVAPRCKEVDARRRTAKILKSPRWSQSLLVESSFGMWSRVFTQPGSCVDGAHGSRGSFGFLLAVGCKSCVRPVCAALIAAGPDVIRRSSPYQSLALDSA